MLHPSLAALLATGLFALAASPACAQTATYLDSFGSFGSGAGQFDAPSGVAIDPVTGSVYVVDYQFTISRVQRFTAAGVYDGTHWGSQGTGNSQFQNPTGIAVDHARDRVYVADSTNNRFGVFDLDGGFVAEWTTSGVSGGAYSSPRSVAVLNRTGDVYLSGTLGVQRVRSSDGSFLGAFGGYATTGDGDISGQGTYGQALNQATGQVYASDFGNHRVQRYDSGGFFELKWGTLGTGPGQFGSPTGVAVDAAGHVYVADASGNSRIQRFTANGVFEFAFGTAGSGDGQFNLPYGLAISPGGILYVADQNNHRVQRWRITEAPSVPTAPTLAITGKKAFTTPKATIPIIGNAAGIVTSVTYKVGKKSGTARGTNGWRFTAKLKPGKNVITVTAHGPGGDSAPAKITVTRKAS